MSGENGTELWLIRHGETEWSAAGKHTSRTDLPLTERGRERAVALREYLRGVEFAAVLRSPMLRAKETCEIAGLESKRVPVSPELRAVAPELYGNIDPGSGARVEEWLREWDYGVYEGRTTREIQLELPGWSVWKDPIVDGETVEHVGERADGVIVRALAASGGAGRVALVAHAHILRILAARWIGLEARGGALFTLGTGSVSVLGYERETRVVQRWNREFA